MRRVVFLMLFQALFISVFAQPISKQLVDGTVAIVADKIILKSEIEKEVLQFKSQGSTVDSAEYCNLVKQFVLSKLLYRQAEIDSIVVSEAEIESQLDRKIKYFAQMIGGVEALEKYYSKTILEIKDEFREPIKEQLLVQQMQAKLTSKLTVSPKEVKAYFNKIPTDSLPYISAEYEVAEIVILPKISEIQREFIVAKMEGYKADILAGKRTFQSTAKYFSEDPGSAKFGGELGFFGRGEMVPEFEAVAFRLKPGEISKIVKSDFGYHLIQMIEKKGERINCRHVLMRPKPLESSIIEARNLLDSIKTALNEKTLTFEQAVKKFSEDENTKGTGGLLRNQSGSARLSPEELGSDVFFYIERLEIGEISSIIALKNQENPGFRIFMLKNKTKPHVANLKEDYPRFQTAALGEKKFHEMQKWFAKTINKTYIKINAEYDHCNILDLEN